MPHENFLKTAIIRGEVHVSRLAPVRAGGAKNRG